MAVVMIFAQGHRPNTLTHYVETGEVTIRTLWFRFTHTVAVPFIAPICASRKHRHNSDYRPYGLLPPIRIPICAKRFHTRFSAQPALLHRRYGPLPLYSIPHGMRVVCYWCEQTCEILKRTTPWSACILSNKILKRANRLLQHTFPVCPVSVPRSTVVVTTKLIWMSR